MATMASHAICNNTIYSGLGRLSSVIIILKTKWLSSMRTVAPKLDNNQQLHTIQFIREMSKIRSFNT